MSKINVEIVTAAIEAGASVASAIVEAFLRRDRREIRRISDILPEDLASRIALLEAEKDYYAGFALSEKNGKETD